MLAKAVVTAAATLATVTILVASSVVILLHKFQSLTYVSSCSRPVDTLAPSLSLLKESAAAVAAAAQSPG